MKKQWKKFRKSDHTPLNGVLSDANEEVTMTQYVSCTAAWQGRFPHQPCSLIFLIPATKCKSPVGVD